MMAHRLLQTPADAFYGVTPITSKAMHMIQYCFILAYSARYFVIFLSTSSPQADEPLHKVSRRRHAIYAGQP